MPEENRPPDESGLTVPPELIRDLRRLQKSVLVPPQIDEAVLGRARLHLARIREMRPRASTPPADESQDLALAAHSNQERERLAARLAPREETPPISIPRPKRGLRRRLALWLSLATGAGLLFWLLSRWL